VCPNHSVSHPEPASSCHSPFWKRPQCIMWGPQHPSPLLTGSPPVSLALRCWWQAPQAASPSGPSLADLTHPPYLPPPHADHPPAAFQSAMLQLAATEIEREAAAKEAEKQNYLSEHCPPLSLPGSMQELQVKTSLTLSLCQSRKHLAASVSLVDLDWPSHLDPLLTCGCPGARWMEKWLERQLGSLCKKK